MKWSKLCYLIGLLYICAIFIPFFENFGSTDKHLKPRVHSDSTYSHHLKTSIPLLIAHYSCITGVLPLTVDLIFDFYTKISVISLAIRLRDQVSLFFAFLLPSILFICFRSEDYMPSLYTAGLHAKNIIVIITMFQAVNGEVQMKRQALSDFLFIGAVSRMTAFLISTYTYYYDLSIIFLCIAYTLQVLSFISAVFVFYSWMNEVALRQKVRFVHMDLLTVEEFSCLVHVLPMLVYGLVCLFWNTASGDWKYDNRKESSLIFYMAVHFVFLVIVTIIPGRIIRMLAVTNMKLLELKQVFVRYVSHEIRSPLNVVHAGLDILRSELQSSSSVAGSTRDLVEDIYSASETAINILNDLLHYEHMDSGTFKLELSWRPLAGVWGSKWKWAFLLAEKSDVTLTVSDSTAATEFGPCFTDEEDEAVASREVYLHMDVYKMDQVIRNLVTNAVKFTGSGGSVDVKISCQLQNSSNTNSIASKVGVEAVGLLRVEVTDSGLGIAEEDQQRVFGQFAQFHQADLQGQGDLL